MSYVPPGRTQERLRAATVDDLRQIPEEKIHEIDEEILKHVEARNIVSLARLYEDHRLEREKAGLDPAPLFHGNVDPVVEVVERGGYDDFGFITFRADYSDEERWGKWEDLFAQRLDSSLARAAGGERIEDKLFIPIYTDSDLECAGLDEIQEAFEGYKEEAGVPPGLDVGVVLVVHTNVMDSLLEPVVGEEPWVVAMDLSFNHGNISQVPEGEYPGYFPVAIDSIIPELYPMLTALTPQSMWATANPIWSSAFGV